MELSGALAALGALAQASRLEVFRLLVRQGPDGLPAGEIATRLRTPPPTLSFHLSQLAAAGLVRARREGRRVLYSADYEGMRSLLAFLTEDCCQGDPAFVPVSAIRVRRRRSDGNESRRDPRPRGRTAGG